MTAQTTSLEKDYCVDPWKSVQSADYAAVSRGICGVQRVVAQSIITADDTTWQRAGLVSNSHSVYAEGCHRDPAMN